jgi:carbamoylphosphate synthase large subunit
MEHLKGKRLLLLGGSLWKDTIRDFASKHEIVLIATGNNRNAGIFEIADEFYDVDSTNAESMKALIINENIDGVYMGGSEPVISSACEYLNELQMPCYCTKKQWEYLQNKEKFKELCISNDLPVAKKYSITLEDLLDGNIDIQYPVITKPSDGSGSNGFSVSNNLFELREGYKKASNNSISGSVIVEEFVKNDGIVVFYTFSEGEMFFSGIEDKYPVMYKEQGSYVAGLFIFESNFKEEFRRRYEHKISKMFKTLDIKEGSIWIEVFKDEKNFYFNEAGYRYGGSISIYPVDYFYQTNQVAADIYYALTGKSCIKNLGSTIPESVPKKRHYGIYAVHLNPGEIKDIKGVKKILELENIVTLPQRMNITNIVASTGSVDQVFTFVHFVFDTVEECKETIEKIHENLAVGDNCGQNMVSRLLNTSSIEIRH